jgi:hypothetical protein
LIRTALFKITLRAKVADPDGLWAESMRQDPASRRSARSSGGCVDNCKTEDFAA